MTDEQLKEAGVPAELVRISLGLEDKEDLIADISQALDAGKEYSQFCEINKHEKLYRGRGR